MILEVKVKLAEGKQVESCLSLSVHSLCRIHMTEIIDSASFMNFETDRLFLLAH